MAEISKAEWPREGAWLTRAEIANVLAHASVEAGVKNKHRNHTGYTQSSLNGELYFDIWIRFKDLPSDIRRQRRGIKRKGASEIEYNSAAQQFALNRISSAKSGLSEERMRWRAVGERMFAERGLIAVLSGIFIAD